MTTGAAREKTQADFDLERFIEMFDEALTSRDERVINALRSLMMMTILTKSETSEQRAGSRIGPLRQLYDDLTSINRRLIKTEEHLKALESSTRYKTASQVYADELGKKWPNQWPDDNLLASDVLTPCPSYAVEESDRGLVRNQVIPKLINKGK